MKGKTKREEALVIVMPTYNEKSNLQKLLPRIKEVFTKNKISGGVLIVDDNSPDGTAEFIRELIPQIKASDFFLELLFRPKKLGLGTAYIAGFQKALSLNPKYILGMDADFSHDPKFIPEIYRQLQVNQMVIGSRYVSGGGIRNWSRWRRILSKTASLYTKLVLGWKINDPTTAFVGFQKTALKHIKFSEIKTKNYAFLVELKYLAHKANYIIKEVPIVFVDRAEGKSKLNKKIVWESIVNVLLLRFRYHK